MEFMRFYGDGDGGDQPRQGQSGAGRMSAIIALATSMKGEGAWEQEPAAGTTPGDDGGGGGDDKSVVGGIAESGGTPEVEIKRQKLVEAEEPSSGPSGASAAVSVADPCEVDSTRSSLSPSPGGSGSKAGGQPNGGVAEASGDGAGARRIAVVESNPLQIPLVLETIFRKCPPRALANCRLVCKFWRTHSLGPWRSILPIKSWIHGRSTIVDGKPLLEFLKQVEDPANGFSRKPYGNLSLDHWIFSSRHVQSDRFWNAVGKNLTSLTLFKCTFHSVDQFRQIIFRTCPTLKNLTVSCTFFEGGAVLADKQEGREYKEPICGEQKNLRSLYIKMGAHCDRGTTLPVSWLEVLSHFPSLTSLKISFIECDMDGEEFGKIMNAFRIIREEDDRKLPVKELELDPMLAFTLESTSHDNLFILQQQRLPLHALKIRTQPDMDGSVLNNILNFHRMSLTKLQIFKGNFRKTLLLGQYFSNWVLPCYVQLEGLQELEVTHVLQETMGFLKCAPNLRKLRIHMGYDFKAGTETFFNSLRKGQELAELKLLALRELDAHFELSRLSVDELRRLGKCMPNLEKLTMLLSDMQFGVVCDQWTGLKELCVRGGELSDKGVTGGGTGQAGAGPSGSGAKKAKTVRGNITALKGLRTFTFESHKVTDESVFNGFLQLPELQHLNAAIWPKKLKFGMKAKKALKARKILLDD